MKAYLQDLRSRVLLDLDGGVSVNGCAAKYRVSASWVRRLRLRRSRRALLESRGTEVTGDADVDRAMLQFRRSLTARESSGVSLFLDRVLLGWFQARGLPLPTLTDDDRQRVAALYARATIGGSPLFRGKGGQRLDRVFW